VTMSFSGKAYRILVDLVYEHSRIRLGADKQTLLANRLQKRLRVLGLKSYDDYCAVLQSPEGAEEIEELVDLISTNHTKFFREPDHFSFLVNRILPVLMPRLVSSRSPLRLWSAAASSGEEAYTMAIDADTTLAPDAIERLLESVEASSAAAACGFVIPRNVGTMWERGRYIEYMFAFSFYKQVQEYYEKPLIASGCFTLYRTASLLSHRGWETRTLAEDMDLTWSMYQSGEKVRFVPEAVCYPIEPHSYRFMSTQLKRWSHGFVQNVSLHWRGLLEVPYLRSAVAVSMWDATLASFVYLVVLPVLTIWFRTPWLLIGYLIDAPAVAVPVLVGAVPRGETRRALASLPAFFVLRTLNAVFFLGAVWAEMVMGHGFHRYEKGH